jgi:hypothetical protein
VDAIALALAAVGAAKDAVAMGGVNLGHATCPTMSAYSTESMAAKRRGQASHGEEDRRRYLKRCAGVALGPCGPMTRTI